MNMSVTYWLNCEDKERCFQIRRKGTIFEKEPAYISCEKDCSCRQCLVEWLGKEKGESNG